jgi:hypothetical protein
MTQYTENLFNRLHLLLCDSLRVEKKCTSDRRSGKIPGGRVVGLCESDQVNPPASDSRPVLSATVSTGKTKGERKESPVVLNLTVV